MLHVTAAVIERDGRILVARRRGGDCFAGLWEFPGGKIEPGEAPRDCLRREILEELGLEVEIGTSLGEYPYAPAAGAASLTLLAFRASIRSGIPVLNDHSEIHWALPAELARFEFAEPDRPLVDRLMSEAALG